MITVQMQEIVVLFLHKFTSVYCFQALKIDEALSQYLGEEAQAAPAGEGKYLGKMDK